MSGYSLEGFDRYAVTIDGIESVRYEIGEGAPLVYFHGGGTYHGFGWARELADRFRLILPYHPNFGESGDADFRSIEAYADHYARLFAAIGLARFHLVGASMGGLLAATYAAQHGDQVARLVLVSPAGLSNPAAPMPDFAAIPPDELPGLFVTDRDFIAPYWPRHPGPDWLALRAREAGASMRARGEDGQTENRLRARLPALTMPVLLLWGTADRILPCPLLDDWRAALPAARSLVIPDGSHLLLDEFAQARAATKDFLLGLDALP
jgi:pimeloyl-ACP methyl ester carboxylesterase